MEETTQFDFRKLGQAIKDARNDRELTREQLGSLLDISSRYLVDIENEAQPPSLQILYTIVTFLDVSVDEYFFPEKKTIKTTQHRQLDNLVEGMSDKGLRVVIATAKEVKEIENEGK